MARPSAAHDRLIRRGGDRRTLGIGDDEGFLGNELKRLLGAGGEFGESELKRSDGRQLLLVLTKRTLRSNASRRLAGDIRDTLQVIARDRMERRRPAPQAARVVRQI